eukprot:6037201-Pyramimonas_sp.AAC.1
MQCSSLNASPNQFVCKGQLLLKKRAGGSSSLEVLDHRDLVIVLYACADDESRRRMRRRGSTYARSNRLMIKTQSTTFCATMADSDIVLQRPRAENDIDSYRTPRRSMQPNVTDPWGRQLTTADRH